MKLFGISVKNKIKFWLIALFVLPFCVWEICLSADDLLWQIIEPTAELGLTIDMWKNRDRVGKNVFEWSTETGIDGEWVNIRAKPSIIVKITRLLLTIVITLSVTVILYNWLTYIIKTGQWEEGKNLISNIIYIVVWILIALFSVVIIRIIQSVPQTLDRELNIDKNNTTDNAVVEGKWKTTKWTEVFKKR